MELYIGKMMYSEESIQKLSEMQYRTFQAGKRLYLFIASVILLLIGFHIGVGSVFGIICIFAGCVLITGIDAPSRRTAKALISQINGKYPEFEYTFTDSGFSSNEEKKECPYSTVLRLIDDGHYYYIYVSEDKAYMVEKSTIMPSCSSGFQHFLSEKTHLSWERPTTIFNMSIKKLYSGKKMCQ